MSKFVIRYILAFLLLIPAQAIIFDHLILFDVAVPEVFISLILMLPITLGTNWSTFAGFMAGVNALCCTVLAFVRKPVFHLYVSADDDLASRAPSSASMEHTAFMKYLLTMTALYCLMLFTVEAFQFFNFRLLVLRVLASTIYTFVLLYAADRLLAPSR